MPRFIISTHHDKGSIDITTHATSAQAAREAVMAAERCPARSILAVRSYDGEKFELDVDTGERRVVAVSDKRESFSKNGQTRPDKVPTRYEALICDETRWRRVYGTRHTGLHYVIRDGLKVVVQLPEAT